MTVAAADADLLARVRVSEWTFHLKGLRFLEQDQSTVSLTSGCGHVNDQDITRSIDAASHRCLCTTGVNYQQG